MQSPLVVLDTNVLVSAMRSRDGVSYKVLSLVGSGRFRFSISVPLVLEYEEVILRELDELPIDEEDVGAFLDYLCAVAQQQKIFYLWRPHLRDVDDDLVLEVAVAAECNYIVSFNTRDFRGVETFGVEVILPRDLLGLIGALA